MRDGPRHDGPMHNWPMRDGAGPMSAGVRWVESLDEVDEAELRVVGPATTKEHLLAAIYRALDAPSYAAANYDALIDILGDLQWLPAGPVRLGWAPSNGLPAQVRAQVLHILVGATSASTGAERPMTLFLAETPAPR